MSFGFDGDHLRCSQLFMRVGVCVALLYFWRMGIGEFESVRTATVCLGIICNALFLLLTTHRLSEPLSR